MEKDHLIQDLIALTILLYFIQIPITSAQVPVIPYSPTNEVEFDGMISENEYNGVFIDNLTNIVIHWFHNGTHIFIALDSPGIGWVSIGFGPSGVKMDGSNIIIGYLDENNTLVLLDSIGVGRQHFTDESKGGSYDIYSGTGAEIKGRTVIEFIVPLDSKDSLDHKFEPGNTYGFFLAYQESEKDTSSFHTAFSELFDLTLASVSDLPESFSEQDYTLVYVVGGLVIILIGGYLYSYFSRPKVYKWREIKKKLRSHV
jgi:hypothetical protein